MVVGYIDRGNMSMVAPLLSKELHLNATDKGYLFSAFLLGYSLMQIPAGLLVDRFGFKWAYAVFYFLWAITTASFSLVHTFTTLILLRILLGVFESVSGPASFAFIATYFPKTERGTASGVFLAGTKVGPAVGAVLAAYLIKKYGWRNLFIITGLLPLLWIIPWLLLNRSIERNVIAVKTLAPPETKVKLSLKAVFTKKAVWGIFLGYFCYGYVWYLYISWLPGYFFDRLHFSINDTGWWTGFSYTGMALITIISGWAADKLIAMGRNESRIRKGFVTAGFLVGSLICVVPLIHDVTQNAILLVIAISGMGLATANTWAITQTLAPQGTVGTLTSIQNFGATFGGVIAPLLTGYIISWTKSYSLPFIIAGVLMLVGILSYTLLIGKLKPIKFQNLSIVLA